MFFSMEVTEGKTTKSYLSHLSLLYLRGWTDNDLRFSIPGALHHTKFRFSHEIGFLNVDEKGKYITQLSH